VKRLPYIKKDRNRHGIKGGPSDRLPIAHDDVEALRELRMIYRTRDYVASMPLNTPQCAGCQHFMGNHHPRSGCFVGGCSCRA
jgi:hypothetical protein